MSRVLVLNKNWEPINVVEAFDAVRMVVRRRADFLDHESFSTYDFDGWVKSWDDAKTVIATACAKMRKPEIIVLREYAGPGYNHNKTHARVKFSRRNVFLRDGGICSYCNRKFPWEDLNLDHVIPRYLGGKTCWENITLSCIKCNDKKRNRTPEEAGMKLRRKPVEPKPSDIKPDMAWRLRKKIGNKVLPSWKTFVDKIMSDMYWNAGIEG